MATTPDYSVNYDDERFKEVDTDEQEALTNVTNQYDDMINDSESYYNDLIEASKDYEQKQEELQNQQTEQTITEINQNKEKAEKDYKKEAMAGYADYKKEQAGAAASMLNAGLQNTGYSESSLVSMYNTYQNRVATAKQSFDEATLNYNNQITEARLANSSALAEIAYNAYKDQLELALESFQYKNTLTTELIDKQLALNTEYYNRRQDVISQINTENSLAEEVRQYNESLAEEQRQYNETMAYQKERDAISDAQWQAEFNAAYGSSSSSSSSSSYSSKSSSSSSSGSGTTLTNGSSSSGTYTGSKNSSNRYGNSASTLGQSDYYFTASSGSDYQPRYINDQKVEATYVSTSGSFTGKSNGSKLTAGKLGLSGVSSSKTIWHTFESDGVHYWVWVSKDSGYMEVTKEVKALQS